MTCSEVRQLLDDFVHGYTDAEQSARIREHLDSCPECTEAFRKETALHRLLGSSAPEPSYEFRASVMERIAAENKRKKEAAAKRFRRYASLAAMLLLTVSLTSFLLIRLIGAAKRTEQQPPSDSSPVSLPEAGQTEPQLQESVGLIDQFFSRYPGVNVCAARGVTELAESMGLEPIRYREYTFFVIPSDQTDAFLTECGKNGITLSDNVPESFDLDPVPSGLNPGDGDMIVVETK